MMCCQVLMMDLLPFISKVYGLIIQEEDTQSINQKTSRSSHPLQDMTFVIETSNIKPTTRKIHCIMIKLFVLIARYIT